jgi:hypothetical protein
MCEELRQFTQKEYGRVLDTHQARSHGLTQGECERLLMGHGASYEQAKNGSYVYLHHGESTESRRRGSRDEYVRLLDGFRAAERAPRDCIRYLESLGFGYRQAQTAVYHYRREHGLIGR